MGCNVSGPKQVDLPQENIFQNDSQAEGEYGRLNDKSIAQSRSKANLKSGIHLEANK